MQSPRELTTEESAWLKRMKQTMALELARCMRHGMPPAALVERLLQIAEVGEALEMRARGGHEMAEDKALARLCSWLDDRLDCDRPHFGDCVSRLSELSIRGAG